MELIDILMGGASVAGGGVLGIFGRIGNRFLEMKERKQMHGFKMQEREFDEKRDIRQHDQELRLYELNMAASAQETEQEIKLIGERGSWSGLGASIAHDESIQDVSQWVQNVRALTRPIVLFSLWVMTLTMFIFAADMRPVIINAVLAMATAATLWWHGDRSKPSASNLTGGANVQG